MAYPGYPPPAKPPRSGADLAISIAALTLTVLLGAAAAFFGLFSLAFLDHCPPETCSVDGAVNAVFTSLLIAGGIGVVGVGLTVVALVRRKRGWPFAIATLALCALAVFLGGVGYTAAVG
ncbi:hypothetical protein H7I57_07470 [Mycobacterium pyrenivorans]|nr:hypothetical protein [Mycolicibacterium pyrenivorans]MCV7151123.1 hypothetical protein [Mycolicibacterium pyrenivorans]